MWTTIKKLLPSSVKKLGLNQVLELNEICLRWEEMVQDLFGENFKNRAKPISLKNKILIVDCLNSTWASEFQLKQIKIINYINNIFNKELIEKIRFIN